MRYSSWMQENSLLRRRGPAGARTAQVEGGIHQRDMGKGLGEVSYQAPGSGIVFFRQQTAVVGQRRYTLKELSCIFITPLQLESTHHPETAGEKDSLSRRKPIRRRRGVIAQHQAAGHQLLLDRLQGAADPRIVSREKARHRH